MLAYQLIPSLLQFIEPDLHQAIGKVLTLVNSPVACWRLTVNSGTGLIESTGQQAGIRN